MAFGAPEKPRKVFVACKTAVIAAKAVYFCVNGFFKVCKILVKPYLFGNPNSFKIPFQFLSPLKLRALFY